MKTTTLLAIVITSSITTYPAVSKAMMLGTGDFAGGGGTSVFTTKVEFTLTRGYFCSGPLFRISWNVGPEHVGDTIFVSTETDADFEIAAYVLSNGVYDCITFERRVVGGGGGGQTGTDCSFFTKSPGVVSEYCDFHGCNITAISLTVNAFTLDHPSDSRTNYTFDVAFTVWGDPPIPKPAMIYYVDADANGVNNGSSWADAYNYLQDALAAAQSGDEIWVAQGIYKPDQGIGITPGDRTATFQLKNGVAIKGGYADFGEPEPNARNIEAYETILSGDLLGNDGPDFANNYENSYHVVTGSATGETAVLDGFTITGGNANSLYPYNCGGGIFNSSSSSKLIDCIFHANSAKRRGGGMYNEHGSPTLTNCTFSENSAKGGGGMANFWHSSTRLISCMFIGNTADCGGGMTNYWSSPTLNNCTIIDNLASGPGGGMYNAIKSPTVVACMFSGNSSGGYGGGMCNATSSPILTNCAFTNNSAENGGGVYNGEDKGPAGFEPSNPTLTNCTFTGNSARYGGGMFNTDASSPILTNCILWGDTSNEVTDEFGCVTLITYSNVQGGWPGEGNIDADPFFVAPRYWDANGVWVDGDYRLLQDSPCIDAGDPNYIAEPNETDLDGRPRVIGERIDMGAYEFNHIPIANAGEDQTVFGWIDGIAEVTLDGTGSYDDDGQPLTYLWSWTIDGQIYDANGVTPTIELPVGEQTIELIVNDGIDDSEPDHVVVTVIEPVESELRIAPRVINRRSRQPKILALVRLPEGVTADQIDSNELLLLCPGGIEAMSQRIIESRRQGTRQTSIFALFDKAELMDAVGSNGSVELQVVGNLKTGQYFYGSDTVRIISPRDDNNGNGRPRRRGNIR